MKIRHIFLYALVSFLIINYSTDSIFALSNFQIVEFCKKQRRRTECLKQLKYKKLKLKQGLPIEIPVEPYRR